MISAQVAEKEIKILLNQGFSNLKNPPVLPDEKLDIIGLEVLVASADRVVGYYNNFFGIDESFKKVKQLSELSFTQLEDIESARELIASSVAHFELSKLYTTFDEWVGLIDDQGGNRHGVRERLIQAIEKEMVQLGKKPWKNFLCLPKIKSTLLGSMKFPSE